MNCAVVTPIYRLPTSSENLSLAIAELVLSSFTRYLVFPDDLKFNPRGAKAIRLPGWRFNSIKSYGALMVDKGFYELFQDFDFVLICQLDCLVFADTLNQFCNLGYDYVAPLILGRNDGFWPNHDIVGVGGFSLRRVDKFIEVLRLLEKAELEDQAKSLEGRIQRNGAEDMFWSLSASTVDPSFSVAPSEVALAFGFEGDPRPSHRRADLQQPFGCHHWNRLSYFLWYLRWIRLPLRLWLRYIPPVLVELFFVEARDLLSRVRRRLSRITAGDSATSRSMLS